MGYESFGMFSGMAQEYFTRASQDSKEQNMPGLLEITSEMVHFRITFSVTKQAMMGEEKST